jgi:DNA-binding transcriptional ArsR family regulator
LENRRRLYDLIRRTPGIHLREVVRALSLPYGTAEYHLRVLEHEGLVRAVADDNFRRYYAADFAFGDRAVLGLLRKRPVRRVMVALLERTDLTHQQLSESTGLKPSTLSYHLTRLEQMKLVQMRRDGRFTHVVLVDPPLISRLMITHGRSFADGAVDRFLETWSGFAVEPAPASAAPSEAKDTHAGPLEGGEPATPEPPPAPVPPPTSPAKEGEEGG